MIKDFKRTTAIIKENINAPHYHTRPIVHILNGKEVVEGVTNPNDRVGDFHMTFSDGKKIYLSDVFHNLVRVYHPDLSESGSALGQTIFVEGEIEEADFYLMTKSESETNSEFNYTYDLHIYDGKNLIHILREVEPHLHILGKGKFIFTRLIDNVSGMYQHLKYDLGQIKEILTSSDPTIFGAQAKERANILRKLASSIDRSDYLSFVFYVDGSKGSIILEEYVKLADNCILVENIFEDDDTRNYSVSYHKSRIDDIAFVSHCLLGSSIDCHAIYGIPIETYKLGLSSSDTPLIDEKWVYNEEQIKSFRHLVMDLYERCNMNFDDRQLPINMHYSEIPTRVYSGVIRKWLENHHPSYMLMENGQPDRAVMHQSIDTIKMLYNKIFSEITEKVPSAKMWKSELKLFRLVKKNYPSAIYQYRSSWLNNQSLDIFIPDLNIGIEYQGIQHYESIEYFGGQNGFKHRQLLDEKKRITCKVNGVSLIEWKYDEPISKLLLDRKLTTY